MRKDDESFQDNLPGLEEAIDDDQNGWKLLCESVRRVVSAKIWHCKPQVAWVGTEDILQDVFETLLKNNRAAMRNLKERSLPEQCAYLIAIAKSRCNDYRRNFRSDKMINDDKVIDPKETVESYEQPNTGLGDKELTEMRQTVFSVLFDHLSPVQAEVLKMRANGSKGREISDKLGMPENTVHSHLKRGIATLSTLASKRFPELCGDTASRDLFLNAM